MKGDSVTENTQWVVLKFGGTSVSSLQRWRVIATESQKLLDKGFRVWVVISAISQVTNLLEKAVEEAKTGTHHLRSFNVIVQKHLNLAQEVGLLEGMEEYMTCEEMLQHIQNNAYEEVEKIQPLKAVMEELKALRRLLDGIQLTEEISPCVQARAYAFGELLSTALGIQILHRLLPTYSSIRVDARKLLIAAEEEDDDVFQQPILGMDDGRFLSANIYPKEDRALAEKEAEENQLVLTQGFIASTPDGKTCVIGRGGSDTSGSLFAALLKATEYQVWTDVHGMYTSDPRDVPSARLIKILTYQQAKELAAMGAKVLHSKCVGPAEWAKIPMEIRNTQDPEGEKTVIMHDTLCNQSDNPKIMAVVKRLQMTLLTITSNYMFGAVGFLSKMFALFESTGMSVDLIATSQFTVSITLDFIPGGVEGESFKQLLYRLKKLATVTVVSPCAAVSIVGRKLRKALPQIGRAFEVLKEKRYEIYLLSESAEDLNMSFVVDEEATTDIVRNMHEHFFPSRLTGEHHPYENSLKETFNPIEEEMEQTEQMEEEKKGKKKENSIQRDHSRDLLLGSEWTNLQE